MAGLTLVCRSLRALAKSSGAWQTVDLRDKTKTDVVAFVKLFPAALRAARRLSVSIAANRLKADMPYGFENFRHLVLHACSELPQLSGSRQEKEEARRDSRDLVPNSRVNHFYTKGLDG
jgi:hypothetical protein